jgi:hypothetical protein
MILASRFGPKYGSGRPNWGHRFCFYLPSSIIIKIKTVKTFNDTSRGDCGTKAGTNELGIEAIQRHPSLAPAAG